MILIDDDRKLFRNLFFIIAAGLAARLLLAWYFYGTSDVNAWEQYSAYWPDRTSPYDETKRYPYSPVWFWIISLCSALARSFHLPFSFVIKWPLALADLGTLLILMSAMRRLGRSAGETTAVCAAFFLNPVSILISGYHGQFDGISLFFALAAWFLFSLRVRSKRLWSAALLSVAVAVKHFNILLIPLFFFSEKGLRRRALFLFGPPLLFLSLVSYYWISSGPEIFRVFSYNLGAGYWGWSGIGVRAVLFFTGKDLGQEAWFPMLYQFNPGLYLAMFAASYWMVKKYDLLDSMTLTFLVFYVFTTQIAPQYSVWIIPFAALRRGVFFYVYSGVAALQLLVFFYCHHYWYHKLPFEAGLASLMPPFFIVLRHLTWAVCAAWLIAFLWRQKGRRKLA